MACNDLSDYPNALFGLHSQALPHPSKMNYSNSLLNATNASSFTAMQLSSLGHECNESHESHGPSRQYLAPRHMQAHPN